MPMQPSQMYTPVGPDTSSTTCDCGFPQNAHSDSVVLKFKDSSAFLRSFHENFVDESVFVRFFRRHPIISIHVALDLLERLPAVFG